MNEEWAKLSKEIEIKTNVPCKIKTTKGMIIAGSKIVYADNVKIRFDDYDRTEVAINEILSIEYTDIQPGNLQVQQLRENAETYQEEKVENQIKRLWKWGVLGLIALILVIIVATNVKVVDDEKTNGGVQLSNHEQEKIANKNYDDIHKGMTLEELNLLIGFEGEFEGESTENGVRYEGYRWYFDKEEKISIGCTLENGKSSVWGITDSKGFRNSLGDEIKF